MVGYVLSMSFGDILAEVNDAVDAMPFPAPRLAFPEADFPSEGIARTSQQLERQHVQPRNFDLAHLWVDLRP